MRVAIVNLTGGGLSGGYRKYLRELMPAIARGADQVDVFLPPQVVASATDPWVSGARTWPADDGRSGYRALRGALRDLAPDVIFFPTARRLTVDDVPTVVMVRNMEPLVTPFAGWVPVESVKNLARIAVAWQACRRATRVIAVSAFVRDFLVDRFRIARGKIGVVPHGVEAPSAASARRPATVPGDVAEFLFTAGSIRPARGLEDAIEALAVLAARGSKLRLLVAGSTDPGMEGYRARIEALARRRGVGGALHWLGGISPAEMSWCLQHCQAFVMTSRVEACPNMVLEAMSHGCLSVSCDARPMPEFFGDAALFYPVGDGAILAARIAELLEAPGARRDALRAAGRANASAYTWEQTAQATLGELRLAASCPEVAR